MGSERASERWIGGNNSDEEKGTREKVDTFAPFALQHVLGVKTYSSISCSATLLMSRYSIVATGNKSTVRRKKK